MTYSSTEDFADDLQELGNPRLPPLKARRISDEIAQSIEQDWFDGSHSAEAESLLGGVTAPGAFVPTLAVGQSWLLLGSQISGRVLRLSARDDGKSSGQGRFGRAAENAARDALRGLEATLGKAGKSVPDRWHRYCFRVSEPIDFSVQEREDEVYGDSLGVAVCAAVLSAMTQTPPRADTAATAQVHSNGGLHHVAFLEKKLEALRKHHPNVTRVVVAEKQSPGGTFVNGIELVRVSTLAEALEYCELTFENCPEEDLGEVVKRVNGFSFDDANERDRATWEGLAAQARRDYWRLKGSNGYEKDATTALSFAILFSAHAGDSKVLGDLCHEIGSVDELDVAKGSPQAMTLGVFEASVAIDEDLVNGSDFNKSLAKAKGALEQADQLAGYPTIRAQALGTYGRALTFAGRYADADKPLREAMAQQEAREDPRSRTYLATNQRLAGKADAALVTIAEALDAIQKFEGRAFTKTKAYAVLERGRCQLALNQWTLAIEDFKDCIKQAQQEFAYEHPRSGAERGLAMAYERAGDRDAASEHYGQCLAVARDVSLPDILRQISAMAIVDRWASTGTIAADEKELLGQLFRSRILASVDDAQRLTERWVY